jgi:ATP-binding cassette subfamily F protein 3
LVLFFFLETDVFKKIGVLSGGEKSRVALCKILLTKANLIILDEPTNHLDIDSKKILQRALIDFVGSLVIVSHDVDFLRPIANKIVDVRKQTIKIYYGDIDYYLEKYQSEFLDSETDKKKTSKHQNNFLSRKDQKRIEAELRNKKYQATKTLNKEIETLENQIASLEKEQKHLLEKLNNETFYSNSNEIKSISVRLKELDKELKFLFEQWEEKNKKVNEILKQFS